MKVTDETEAELARLGDRLSGQIVSVLRTGFKEMPDINDGDSAAVLRRLGDMMDEQFRQQERAMRDTLASPEIQKMLRETIKDI